jgi:hypothetical protein
MRLCIIIKTFTLGDNTLKKLICIFLALIMSFSTLLAGCNIIEIDQIEYLQQIVATVDNDIKITKEQLINAYSSYGYQYVESYDMTTEEAIEKTLELLINRELVIKYARENYELTQNEKNELTQSVYDYINEQILEIETDVRTEWDRPLPDEVEEETEEDTDETSRVFEPYEQKFELVGGNVVKIEDEDLPETQDPAIGAFVQEISEIDISTEAYNRYITELIDSEYGKGLSTISIEVLQREIDRIYEIYEDNEYISKLEEIFDENSTVENADILVRYKELVRADQTKYSENIDEYITAVKDGTTIYYHPSIEFVYVTHILIPYTDEQTATIEQAETDLTSGQITQADYDAIIASIAENISGYAYDENGEQTDNLVSIDDIYAEVLAAVSSAPTLTEKAEAFNELIYKYNTDDGIFNKEFYYSTALDSANDTMVTEFADAARALYEEDDGLLNGRLSEPVLSEYGWHIIFYSKPVTNLVSYSSLESVTVEMLFTNRLNEGVSKTWYNLIYDDLPDADFDTYQTSLIATLKKDVTITLYTKRYSDLWK